MRNVAYLLTLSFFINTAAVFGMPNKQNAKPTVTYFDSSIILVPFEYKQSTLYHAFTFEVIDSVVNLLLKNNAITLTINGYAHPDEGSDTICKYLSLNRALFVRDYILGRGVADARIVLVQGMGKTKSVNSNVNKNGRALNCRAELQLNYPPPPKPVVIADVDEDGIADANDNCVNEYGYKENNGCPDKNMIFIPFENQQAWLSPLTYKMLDSVVVVLKNNLALKIVIQGHAYKTEGIISYCQSLAIDRAAIVKKYLCSRNIAANRIVAVQNFGAMRPCNAGRTPQEISLNARVQIMLEQ